MSKLQHRCTLVKAEKQFIPDSVYGGYAVGC